MQPSQQLFRSILVGLPDETSGVDHESLSILERAIGLYRSRGSTSGNSTEENRYLEDYATLDAYLLYDSMERYGLLKKQRP